MPPPPCLASFVFQSQPLSNLNLTLPFRQHQVAYNSVHRPSRWSDSSDVSALQRKDDTLQRQGPTEKETGSPRASPFGCEEEEDGDFSSSELNGLEKRSEPSRPDRKVDERSASTILETITDITLEIVTLQGSLTSTLGTMTSTSAVMAVSHTQSSTQSPAAARQSPNPPSGTALPTPTAFVVVSNAESSRPSSSPSPTEHDEAKDSASASANLASSSTGKDSKSIDDPGSLNHLNNKQRITIWSLAVLLVFCLVSWNMLGLCWLMHPFKMLVILIHELSHITAGILTGAHLHTVTIDPEKGGLCGMTSGIPIVTLSAGYVGSSIVGSALILAGFDTQASKVACLAASPLWLAVFWFGLSFSVRIRIVAAVGLMISLWFIDHGAPLRFYNLFIGVLNCFYVVLDFVDDVVFRKENESDAAMFSRLFPSVCMQLWAIIWLVFSLLILTLGVLGGIHFFPQDNQAMEAGSIQFLPTR